MTNERQDVLTPDARNKIKAMINDVVDMMVSMDSIKKAKSDVVDEISKQFKIPKKQLNKLIKARYTKEYNEMVHEHEDFEFLYESLFQTNNNG